MQIECCQTRLCCIKQCQQRQASRAEVNKSASDPRLHHHIGQSEKIYSDFGHYLCSHAKDPAMKVSNYWLGGDHSKMSLRTSCLDWRTIFWIASSWGKNQLVLLKNVTRFSSSGMEYTITTLQDSTLPRTTFEGCKMLLIHGLLSAILWYSSVVMIMMMVSVTITVTPKSLVYITLTLFTWGTYTSLANQNFSLFNGMKPYKVTHGRHVP